MPGSGSFWRRLGRDGWGCLVFVVKWGVIGAVVLVLVLGVLNYLVGA